MKKIGKKDENLEKQSIMIVNKRFFEVWEQIGFVLHILALVLGVSSIIFELIHFEMSGFEEASLVLEILTIAVVFLIVTIHILTPLLKQRIVRRSLKVFWGSKKVNVSLKWPKEIEFGKDGIPKLKSADGLRAFVTDVDIYWDRTKIFEKRLKYKMKTEIEDANIRELILGSDRIDNNYFYEEIYSPMHIIYNGETKILTMLVKRKMLVEGELINREWLFHFDSIKEEVLWSGFMPDSPVYGEWDWNTINR